jgi:hypothetical protein
MMRSLVLLLLLGCGVDEAAEPVDPTVGSKVRLDFEGGGFWDAPLPSSHRFEGGLDLSGFPNPDDVGLVNDILALAQGQMEGAGTTSSVTFRLEVPPDPASLPDLRGSLEDDASVFLIGVEPGTPDHGVRVPVDVQYTGNAVPFGDTDLLTLLPLQGRPLHAGTRYAAVITRDLLDRSGAPFGHSPVLDGDLPPGYIAAMDQLDGFGVPPESIAGLAAFTTQDPEAELRALHADLIDRALPSLSAWTPAEDLDSYCVFEATLPMPVYQHGEPPFDSAGGTFLWDGDEPILQGTEEARVVLTLPKSPMPSDGWPTVAFVRTGGGGDRPLVDRGIRNGDGIAPAGTGYAADFAQVGFAGISIDGPHGGLRNITGRDEQFLMFNIGNVGAMRDNVRQSAVELTLIPDLLDGLEAPGCDGGVATFDGDHLALFGHSMGATIGPLTLALEPRFGAAIFSGGGGSWIHNVVHKQSPLEVRPLAEAMLRYADYGRTLGEHDPVLSLLQWVGESADPPVWGRSIQGHNTHILMLQGIVDTYILPPMANALSLSLGLDFAGPSEDVVDPRLDPYLPLGDVLDLGGGAAFDLPYIGQEPRSAVVVQHIEDGVEDGHEVAFQRPDARRQVRCFLAEFATGRPPGVPIGEADDLCP